MNNVKALIESAGHDFQDFVLEHPNEVLAALASGDNQALADAISAFDPSITQAESDTAVVGSAAVTGSSSAKFLICNSGRFYAFSDDRWVTDSDDNYGSGYYQFQESGTTSSDPVIEWEHMGYFIPAGTVINNFSIAGRANNTSLTEVELYGFLRRPDPITRWETGMDSDAEDVVTDLFRDNFWNHSTQGTFTGNTSDTHKRTFPIDIEVLEDSYLSIMAKLTNTSTSTRYFMHTYTWECTRV